MQQFACEAAGQSWAYRVITDPERDNFGQFVCGQHRQYRLC